MSYIEALEKIVGKENVYVDQADRSRPSLPRRHHPGSSQDESR